jgi:5-methyltetrahydrofolate--homocysteine methyltransferase
VSISITEQIRQSVIDGQLQECIDNVTHALSDGVDAETVLNDGLISAMAEVGRRFREGEFFVPEVLIAARAMNGGMSILEPKLTESGVEPKGRLVIGTVKDDIHDIGKNLVGMMLKGAGFEVTDLGHDVSADKFVEAARDGGVDAVLMSSLLTTTMPNMANTVAAIKDAGLRDGLIIMVGGAPLSERFAGEIGADGFAPDAASAVDVLEELLNKKR